LEGCHNDVCGWQKHLGCAPEGREGALPDGWMPVVASCCRDLEGQKGCEFARIDGKRLVLGSAVGVLLIFLDHRRGEEVVPTGDGLAEPQ